MLHPNFKTMNTFCSGLLFAALVSANVQAEIYTHSYDYGLSGNTSFNELNDGSVLRVPDSEKLYELPQFDSSLGSLQSVTLRIEGDLYYDSYIDAHSPIDENELHSVIADYQVGIGIAVGPSLTTYDLFPGSIACEDVGDFGCETDNFGDEIIDISQVFTGTEMNDFIGTGNLSGNFLGLLAGMDSQMTLENLSGAFLELNLEFDGIFTVEYETSAVPLPAAVWFYGTAVAGLGLMRRRKA